MSKKVSYDVSYQVCGRANAIVPDYIQTRDEARAKVYFRENLEDIYHHINGGNRAQFILSENVSMSTPDGVYEVRGKNDKFI